MGGKRPCNSFVKIRQGGIHMHRCNVSLSGPLFFSADDESSLFNPDCAMKLLVDSIRKTCNCPSREP